MHVDHDHETGKVRGVLCYLCNLALGYVHDDVKVLQTMIDYLNKADVLSNLDIAKSLD
jgi:hypothetical protein